MCVFYFFTSFVGDICTGLVLTLAVLDVFFSFTTDAHLALMMYVSRPGALPLLMYAKSL